MVPQYRCTGRAVAHDEGNIAMYALVRQSSEIDRMPPVPEAQRVVVGANAMGLEESIYKII